MKVKTIVGLSVLAVFLAAPLAWAGDGDNFYLYGYGPTNTDPLSNNVVRGVASGSDLDGDGKYEIIITDWDNGGQVHVYEVVANDSVEWKWSSPGTNLTSAQLRQVHTGDMDNDGVGEIIFVLGTSSGTDTTDEEGIYVYEWDGITDNGYGITYSSHYLPHPEVASSYLRVEDFAIGDIDGDGDNEMAFPANKGGSSDDYLQILSVSGDFSGAHTWVVEDEYARTGAHPFGGSPHNAGIGDMDGDGLKEALFGVWDYGTLYIVETTDTNTYAYQTDLELAPTGDDHPQDNFLVTDLDTDGADEVYFNLYPYGQGGFCVVTGGTDVSLIDTTNNRFWIRAPGQQSEYGYWGQGLGDQDHGVGSDGMDIYQCTWNADGTVFDWEFTGTDPTDSTHWTRYVMTDDYSGSGEAFACDVPGVDMDGDGRKEIVIGYATSAADRSWWRVFEWSELPAHDLSVEAVSPTWTIMGADSFAATIKNNGGNAESNFEVYWESDVGDSSSETYSGTLASLAQDNITLNWTPDTTGMYRMTVWTDLATDLDSTNDTKYQNIYNYPSETGQYSHAYGIETPNRVRGIAVFGNDDFVAGVTRVIFQLEFYHNAPSAPDIIETQWSDADTTFPLYYHWGIGIDTDNNVYLCHQYPDLSAQALVWDYDGNEVDWLALGYSDKKLKADGDDTWELWELQEMAAKGEVKGTTYPSALDVDDNGYVYVAWYWPDTTRHKYVEIYPPMASWSNHQAALAHTFNAGLDQGSVHVCEGLCVNSDGSVMWVTQRSGTGSAGWVSRWTGSPTGPYTQDGAFGGDGRVEIPGCVRGLDLAPDGDIYVCSDDDGSFDRDKVFIIDGTTGELKFTIDIDSPGYRSSPYDLEFSLVGAVDLTIEKAAADAYLSWSVPTATALYVTHLYDWFVDKWEGPGFKAVTSYEVYRDTIPDFEASAATLLDTTSNSYYLDVGAVGNTSLNYYYIVKSKGTPGYASKSTTVGEYDRDVVNLKKKGAPEKHVTRRSIRPVTGLQTRPEPTQEKASTSEKKRR